MIKVTTEDRTLDRDITSKALIAKPGAAKRWQDRIKTPIEKELDDLRKRVDELEKKVNG